MVASWRERLKAVRDRFIGKRQEPSSSDEVLRPESGRTAKPKPVSRKLVDQDAALSKPNVALTPKARRPQEESKSARKPASGKSTRARKAKANVPVVVPKSRPIAINLGIDFGTSFTKVCFRDIGSEDSGVVAVGKGFKEALVPSVVVIGANGKLYVDDEAGRLRQSVSVTYLKMRLAGETIDGHLPEIAGLSLDSQDCVKALSAWFLASIIVRSQKWMERFQSDRMKNRDPIWSANVGVPVEHFDSEALQVFEEVLGVAWLWVKDQQIPATLRDAMSMYRETEMRLGEEVSDFHALPEIAAAVQSFVMSREAVPGIYVYFDIGGGTVDGVAFNFLNYGGERKINFYSGKVAPLGVSSIGSSLNSVPKNIDAFELERLLKASPKKITDQFVHKIRLLTAKVIMEAKQKDGRDWQEDAFQNTDYQRKFIGSLTPARMRPLIVFIGGGGSKSNWYRSTIESTYSVFKHSSAGVPPYKLLEVPRPSDLLPSEHEDEFIRFAISYGLSIPFGEGPDIRLPSQLDVAEPPQRWSPRDIVDYADSKDVYG